jgi:hypothetical protein
MKTLTSLCDELCRLRLICLEISFVPKRINEPVRAYQLMLNSRSPIAAWASYSPAVDCIAIRGQASFRWCVFRDFLQQVFLCITSLLDPRLSTNLPANFARKNLNIVRGTKLFVNFLSYLLLHDRPLRTLDQISVLHVTLSLRNFNEAFRVVFDCYQSRKFATHTNSYCSRWERLAWREQELDVFAWILFMPTKRARSRLN